MRDSLPSTFQRPAGNAELIDELQLLPKLGTSNLPPQKLPIPGNRLTDLPGRLRNELDAKVLRAHGPEPLEMFRQYFAVYAREQAYCHFSPALIANLEKYWNAASRKP